MIETKTKKRIRRSYVERGMSPEEVPTMCVCPKCEEPHIKKMKWIGRGIPPKFCPTCAGRIGRLKGLPSDVIGYKFHEFKGGESDE